jgi:hypothetical protein
LTKIDLIEDKNTLEKIITHFKKLKVKNVLVYSAFDEETVIQVTKDIEKLFKETKVVIDDNILNISDEELVINFQTLNASKKIEIIYKDKK